MDDIVEWSDSDIEAARAILEKNDFTLQEGLSNTYICGKATVGLSKRRITIENPETQMKTILDLLGTLRPGYCIDDDCEFYLPSDWQDTISWE